MPDTTLGELLARNARYVDGLPQGYFDDVEDGQEPAAVSVCCSDSRVSQEGMWAVEDPGWLFTPSTIGNQVWDRHDGDLVVDGSVLYPIVHTDTRVTVVVGHTGCGAVTAALEATREGLDAPPGIEKWVELLVPVVESALAASTPTEAWGSSTSSSSTTSTARSRSCATATISPTTRTSSGSSTTSRACTAMSADGPIW